jgi:hypothetical protein
MSLGMKSTKLTDATVTRETHTDVLALMGFEKKPRLVQARRIPRDQRNDEQGKKKGVVALIALSEIHPKAAMLTHNNNNNNSIHLFT